MKTILVQVKSNETKWKILATKFLLCLTITGRTFFCLSLSIFIESRIVLYPPLCLRRVGLFCSRNNSSCYHKSCLTELAEVSSGSSDNPFSEKTPNAVCNEMSLHSKTSWDQELEGFPEDLRDWLSLGTEETLNICSTDWYVRPQKVILLPSSCQPHKSHLFIFCR